MFIRHFFCLLKKNYTLISRNLCGFILEVFFSLFCIIALVLFRKIEDKILVKETSYLKSQKTIYPYVFYPNTTEIYDTLSEIGKKYNYSFPYQNGIYISLSY